MKRAQTVLLVLVLNPLTDLDRIPDRVASHKHTWGISNG